MKKLNTIFLAVTIAVLGAGCESQQADNVGEPPIGEILVIDDLRAFALPLDKYRYIGPRSEVIWSAERVLIAQCMAGFGFDYRLPDTPDTLAAKRGGASRRYGVADEAMASQRGYHPPLPTAAEQEYDTASRSFEESLTPEQLTVLIGRGQSEVDGQAVPDGGCVGEARRRLAAGGGPLQMPLLSDNLSGEAFDRTRQDGRVRAAAATWSSCMGRAGYTYSDSWQANNDPAWSADEPTLVEITVAVLDVQCKKEANLVNIMATVEVAYQQRAIEANAEALAALDRDLDARARLAADVLAARQ